MASYFHIWMSPGHFYVVLDVASYYLYLLYSVRAAKQKSPRFYGDMNSNPVGVVPSVNIEYGSRRFKIGIDVLVLETLYFARFYDAF